MINTHEIPPEQWIPFCNRFSREHLGWPVIVEVLLGTLGTQPLARNLPFQGISFDTKGTRPSSVEIAAGDDSKTHIAHTVELPLHIWLANEDDDRNGTLKIEPGDGPPVLVHYHQPA